MWWQKEELQQCQWMQQDMTNESQESKEAMKRYIDAYIAVYEDVFRKTKHAAFNDMISVTLYKTIVEGRGGFELYCDQPTRRRENRNKVLLTVASYQYFKQTEKKSNVDSQVRSYSRSLTAADRYWASVIGNADASNAV
jgi:Ni,Fe-hydrogenase I large subunit